MESQKRTAEEIQQMFDNYIKTCLRNFMNNYRKAQERQSVREVLFSELPDHYIDRLQAPIDANILHHYFEALEYPVAVESDELSQALQQLSSEKRTIILLYYFLGMTDGEIGTLLNSKQERIKKTRQRTLVYLRKRMENI